MAINFFIQNKKQAKNPLEMHAQENLLNRTCCKHDRMLLKTNFPSVALLSVDMISLCAFVCFEKKEISYSKITSES